MHNEHEAGADTSTALSEGKHADSRGFHLALNLYRGAAEEEIVMKQFLDRLIPTMKTSTILGVAVVIILAGAYMLFDERPGSAQNQTGGEDNTSMMRAEENAVVVMEQRPGDSVTASTVFLASPGFVVIHEDANGAPGAILGASALLQAGESNDIDVTVNRATRDGERLHVMLHNDIDGDGAFAASTDTPVQSRLGGPISGWFDISSDASPVLPEVSI